MNLDLRILYYFNSWTNHNKILDWFFIFCANYIVYIFAAAVILYWFFYPEKTKLLARKAVILSFLSFVVARLIITELIRAIDPRQRPQISNAIVSLPTQPSFPSGHATAMFSIAMAIYFYNRSLGKYLLVIAVITAFARVIIGAHYLSDVVGGAIIGILTAWVVDKWFTRRIEPTTLTFSEASDRAFPFTKPQ